MTAFRENLKSPQKGSNLKSKLGSLYGYMKKRLQIKQAPKLILSDNVANANQPFGKTGYYDHKNRSIQIYITNRHPTDILRSFAHEVIHHWQNERGQLRDSTNPHYAQENAWLRQKEYEAFLYGSVLFRDWQDLNRYGPPKTSPSLPILYE